MDELIDLLNDTNWELNNLLVVFRTFPNEVPTARLAIENSIKQLNERSSRLIEKHSLTNGGGV